MNKKAIVFLADGFEETEALAPIDIMRRCGISVTLITINSNTTVTSSHNIVVVTEQTINQPIADYDLILLPGGMPGTLNLNSDDRVKNEILKAASEHKHIAAICAAPMILGQLGLLKGRNATCFPGFEQHLQGAHLSTESVVTDGNITTAIGAGASLKLGVELVAVLLGREAADKVASQIQMK